MQFLTFLCFLPIFSAFDYSEEARKYVDDDVNPCDDFYRHACRLGDYSWLPKKIVSERVEPSLKATQKSLIFERRIFDFLRDHNKYKTEYLTDRTDLITSIFNDLCTSGQNSSDFLTSTSVMLFGDTECIVQTCLAHLSKDSDCERASKHIVAAATTFASKMGVLPNIDIRVPVKEFEQFELLYRQTETLISNFDNSKSHELDSLFLEIKDIAVELIQKTPWASNHNVTDLTSYVVGPLKLNSLVERAQNMSLIVLEPINNNYLKCMKWCQNATVSHAVQYCSYFAIRTFTMDPEVKKFIEFGKLDELFEGGYTLYPDIDLGFVWYYMFLHTADLASQLGSTVFTLAHEVSHALIKSFDGDLLTYFSNEARNCIQSQYVKTCKEFDEGNCTIGEEHFEENGADILGGEIIEILFERHFNSPENKFDEVEKNEHLKRMFYSMAGALCLGEKQAFNNEDNHAASNVRINAVANRPAFQKAFQCPDDSRMMLSKSKQCSVYGEQAPLHRRRFFPSFK